MHDFGHANLNSLLNVPSVSLPSSLEGTALVDDIVPTYGTFLEDGDERMLKPRQVVEEEDERRPHWEPVEIGNIFSLMRRLVVLGPMKALPAGSCVESSGLFFVKKPGRMKSTIIVDARRAEDRFASPRGVDLRIAETIGLEVSRPANPPSPFPPGDVPHQGVLPPYLIPHGILLVALKFL